MFVHSEISNHIAQCKTCIDYKMKYLVLYFEVSRACAIKEFFDRKTLILTLNDINQIGHYLLIVSRQVIPKPFRHRLFACHLLTKS